MDVVHADSYQSELNVTLNMAVLTNSNLVTCDEFTV